MAKVVLVTGVSRVTARMRKNPVVEKKFEYGLKRAGLFVQRESQEIVPVLTGNLKNSAGTRAKGSGFKTSVWVYYTAAYAVYVHERTELRHKEGKQAKFLEQPIRQNRRRILKIIAGRKT